MKKLLLFCMTISCCSLVKAHAFATLWQQMQKEYNSLEKIFHNKEYAQLEQSYCHANWKKFKNEVKQLILSKPNRKFLEHPTLIYTMVRKQRSIAQAWEIAFLRKCVSEKTKEQINKYKDNNFGLIPKKCHEFDCSINTLGHLYYAARIFEQSDNIKSIVEFGGGYGNLALIFKSIIPDSTLFIIDLPELLTIQYLFLKGSLETKVKIHHTIPEYFEDGAIHLIPIFLIDDLQLDTDLFVSTFGLSEAPELVQKRMIQKEFFNAKTVYISGQLDKWGNFNVPHHSILLNGIRNYYEMVSCNPFHLFLANLQSYEVIANK